MSPELEPIKRLTKDIKASALLLSPREARYLVDSYYAIQDYRKAAGNQVSALTKTNEPKAVITWLSDQMRVLEDQIKRALDAWTDQQPTGRWAKSITGIGPVIAAGLLAYIDITKAPAAGHIWRYAGLDSTQRWLGTEKAKKTLDDILATKTSDLEEAVVIGAKIMGCQPGTLRNWATSDKTGKSVKLTRASLARAMARRPWSANLKVLTWKIGESFVKFSGSKNDHYGRLYVARKVQENESNEAGKFSDIARQTLQDKTYDKAKDAFKWYSGQFSPFVARLYRVRGLVNPDEGADEVEEGGQPEQPEVDVQTPAKKKSVVKAKVPTESELHDIFAGHKSVRPEAELKMLREEVQYCRGGVPMLPPAHIHARAKRYAVKLFLAHYHHVAYQLYYEKEPPKPYILEHGGGQHVHYLAPPNF